MFHDDVVLIKVGNLYIQYNKAKGYNMDADMPDLVTITEATSFDDVSDRLAALAEGERYAYASFDKFNNTLIIEVCSLLPFSAGNQMDYGIVSIYLDNGVQKSACNTTYTSQPTVAPSSLPTGAPATLMESTPTSAPIIVDTWTTEAPTADGNSSDALNGSDSSVPIVDNDDPVESAGSNKGGNGAKTGAILAGYVMCVLAVVAAAVYVGKKVCRSKPESLRQRNNRFVRAQSRKVWDLSDTSCNTDDGNVITETRSDGLDIAITP